MKPSPVRLPLSTEECRCEETTETKERTTQKKQREKNLSAHIELRIVPVPTSNRGKPYNLWSMGRAWVEF